MEEHSNTQRTPYLFTSKELDEETGLYYFGARYYDPRTSAWQSPDPILVKYLPSSPDPIEWNLPSLENSYGAPTPRWIGRGGVFEPKNLSTYSYAHLQPVRYVDPQGEYVSERVAAALAADLVTPEPTDAAWPKWVGWGIAIGGAAAIDYIFFNDSAEDTSRTTTTTTTTTQTDTDERDNGNFAYRALSASDNPAVGLFARNPSANRSARDHVRLGSRESFESQFISASRSLDVAQSYDARGGGHGVVRIDLDQVIYLDVSGGIEGAHPLDPAQNYARRDQEILIIEYVPPSAITYVE